MDRAREMSIVPYLSALRSGMGTRLGAVLDRPFAHRTRAVLRRIAEAGTASYPPDVRRRLKILNMIAYLIAITTLIYAIQQSVQDYKTYAPMILLNLVLVVTVLMVPLAHRINEIAGGLLIVGAEYAASCRVLVIFSFSREAGTQLPVHQSPQPRHS